MDHKLLIESTKSLITGEYDMIANLSNISALLNEYLEDINWVGFYLYKEEQLILGPFQGKPACIRIPMHKGVCGKAASELITLRIKNVQEFEGHIACDAASRSEIVIPIIIHGHLFGVLDVDSPYVDHFSEEDESTLNEVVHIFVQHMEDTH